MKESLFNHHGSLGKKLILGPLVALVGFLLLAVLALSTLIENVRQSRETQLITVVELARTIAENYQAEEKSGALSREAAQAKAKQAIRAMRYGQSDYIWINDMGDPYPKMLMHPIIPALDGTILDKASYNTAYGTHARDGKNRDSFEAKNLF